VVFGRSEEEPSPQQRLTGTTTTTPAEPEPSGPREGLILLLFVIVTLAVTAYVLLGEENSAVDDPVQKAARGEVRGLDELSLVREKNFRRVLEKVRSGARPLVADVRLAPERADITVQDRDGSRKILSFDPGLGVKERDFGVSTSKARPASAIDPGAPERMVRGAAEESGMSADALDYVTTTFLIETRPTWTVAFDKGPAKDRLWIAEFGGRDVRRSGELSTAQKNANARTQREARASLRRLKQRTACLSRAATAQDAARCLRRFPP
jgi:hypothetical protein